MGDIVRYLTNNAIPGLIIGSNNAVENLYTFPPLPGDEDQYLTLDENNNLQWTSGGGSGGIDSLTNSDLNLTITGSSALSINLAEDIEIDGTLTLGAGGASEYTLPAIDGEDGQVLKTNGSGVVTWEDDAAGAVASVSGTSNQISASTIAGAVTLSLPSSIIAPGTLTATSLGVTSEYTLPAADGSSGQVLKTDGAGTVTWQADAGGAVASVSGTSNQIAVSPTTGSCVVSLPNTIITPGSLNINNAYTFPTTDGSINQVLKTNGAGSVAWSTDQAGTVASVTGTTNEVTVSPTTGACVVSLPNAVTIQSTLAVGPANMSGESSIGSFTFDNMGNINLPLFSNGDGYTYIRAGDNTGTTTNGIDIFGNWDGANLFGYELVMDNAHCQLGITSTDNILTNFVQIDNTTNEGQGTITSKVQVNGDPTTASTTIQDTVSLITTLTHGNYLKLDDGLTSVGNGTFTVSCHNTDMNTDVMLSFTNSSTVGGILQVPYLTAATYNVNGSYDLPNATTNTVGDVLTVTGTGSTAFVTPGALTGRLIVSSSAASIGWIDSSAGNQVLLPAISGQAYQITDFQLLKLVDTTSTVTLRMSAFDGTTYTDYWSITAANFNTLENTYQCSMSSRNSSGVPVIALGNAAIGNALANQSIVFRQTGGTPDTSGGFDFSFSYYMST
ncbi:MAG: hypothetical protein WCN88_05050 [Candidatus Falkowbacteria bacterium]